MGSSRADPQRFAPVRGAGWRLAVRVVARVEADQAANVSADPAHHLLLREHAPTTHAGLFARSTAVCRLRARAARRSGAWGKGARSPSPRHPRAAWTALFPRATPASVDATVPTCKPAAVLILQVRAGLAQAEAAQSELPLGEEDEELAVDGLVDAGCSGVSQQRFIVDFFTHFHFAARPASAPAEHVQQLARAQQSEERGVWWLQQLPVMPPCRLGRSGPPRRHRSARSAVCSPPDSSGLCRPLAALPVPADAHTRLSCWPE